MASHAAPRGSRFRLALPRGLSTGTAVVAAAAALIGTGTFAAWTSTSASTTGTLTAADVAHTNVDENSTTFTTALSTMLPGDFFYRYMTVTNTGTVAQTVTGAVTNNAGVLVNTAGGLNLTVDKCSVAWTGGTSASTCSGTTTSVLTQADTSTGPAISYGSMAAGAVLHVRYKFALPSGASQGTFNNASGTVTVTLTGATAAGSDRTAG